MKTVTGRVNSAKPISLAKAATLLSGFVSSETQASQDVSAYLRRASAAFIELKSFHREIRSTNPKSELGGAKGTDDLVENETVSGDESVHGRKQDKKKKRIKESKEEDLVDEKVMVRLEDEQRNKERKKKKKKKKKSKKEDLIDENVNEKLEEERKDKKNKNRKNDGEIGSEEQKTKKKRKSKEIDV